MLQRQLDSHLRRADRRLRAVRMCYFVAAAWTLLALVGAGLLLAVMEQGRAQWAAAGMIAAAAGLLLAAWVARWRRPLNRVAIARAIERKHPELDSCLLTAVEQVPQFANGRFGVLQEAVLRRALSHARRNPWERTLLAGRLWRARVASALALCLVLLVAGAFLLDVRPGFASIRPFSPLLPTTEQAPPLELVVEPGDTELEVGAPLVVLARFQGEAALPSETALVWEDEQQESHRIEMTRNLADRVFGGRIAAVAQPLTYRVEYRDQSSDSYRVAVFEYPRLDRADAELKFPKYTSKEPRLVEDTRTVSAVQGSELTWTCHLNKPVAEAHLESSAGELLPLTADAGDPQLVRLRMPVKQSERYTLRLVDADGRQNQRPAELRVRALPNRPPRIKIIRPARDLQVSPLEETPLQAQVSDDYGLARFGLTLERPGLPPAEVVLGDSAAGVVEHLVDYLVEMEQLGAEPDQLITYHFWAEDRDAEGRLRTTQSDMYFLEVRPFEEIFRQGEQPSNSQQQQQQQQQQGGAAKKTEELAELQKQIINATWKVLRQRPEGGELTESAELLATSQSDAIQQAGELGQEIQDAQSKQHLAAAIDAMMRAHALLEQAADADSEKLREALAPEREAYQSLLRLRAREHEVVRQQSQQSSSSSQSRSSSSRSQQQIQQLQLDQQANRYETQRQAQSLQDPQQRETRQVLNRLKELAQRQEDVNKRVKELQSALEEAQTKEQRDELERQLKRLRDEQQQVLRDVDELQNRMDENANQESQQMQQQLQETRERVRDAGEALEQGNLPQAAAEGARAEEQLNELRDEARRQAAGQFDQQSRQLREQARELAQRQTEIAERIQRQQDAPAKSLRDNQPAESGEEGVKAQRERLQTLLQDIQDTVEAAEDAEPLLAKHLYDAFRTARQARIDQQLEETQRWLGGGFFDEAKPAEEEARAGIEQLRDDVERAAESVLGDPAEALRRAQEELKWLAEDIDREIDQSRQPQDGQPQRGQPQEGQPQEGQPQEGQPQEGQPQRGQPQPGQPQPGQPQPGQPQPGQPQPGQPQPGQPQPGQPQPGQPQPGQPQQGQPQQGQPQQGQPQQGQPQQGQPQQGQPQQGQPQQGQPQQGQPQQGQPQQGQPQQGQPQAGGFELGGFERMAETWSGGPITGGGFRDWTDRLRDVEEMVEDPELQSEAARIRDRVRNLRMEMKRHSKEPNWELVEKMVAQPLEELRNRVAEELRRLRGDDQLAPLDRDPVPERYEDRVRQYYERLGAGR